MQKLVIKGSRQLSGTVKISGAKNAALPILAATLLAEGEYRLENVPALRDISTMRGLLEQLDIVSEACGEHCYSFNNNGGSHFEAPYDLVNKMRASILVLGPLLAKRKKARVSLPGGCAIGARPVDLHISALEKMGAEIDVSHGYIEAKCKGLVGNEIFFDKITVTGTENIMMAATLAQGVTTLHNAAAEPEVCDLANFLRSMGAKISGDGSHTIVIEGVENLHPAVHSVMSDRIEAGTFMCAVLATGGSLHLENVPVSSMDAVFAALIKAGLEIHYLDDSSVEVFANKRPHATDITTMPYPGFPTDMQAQFMAAMVTADGASIINETIFENRFMHVAELKRMGADITLNDGIAMVRGVEKLSGAPVMASDLRASAGLVIAALAADNTSELHRVYHLDRGYDSFDKKLDLLGANITRANEN